MRKPVFGVFFQVLLKTVEASLRVKNFVTETSIIILLYWQRTKAKIACICKADLHFCSNIFS